MIHGPRQLDHALVEPVGPVHGPALLERLIAFVKPAFVEQTDKFQVLLVVRQGPNLPSGLSSLGRPLTPAGVKFLPTQGNPPHRLGSWLLEPAFAGTAAPWDPLATTPRPAPG